MPSTACRSPKRLTRARAEIAASGDGNPNCEAALAGSDTFMARVTAVTGTGALRRLYGGSMRLRDTEMRAVPCLRARHRNGGSEAAVERSTASRDPSRSPSAETMRCALQATNGPVGNEDHDGAAIVQSLTVDVATSRITPCQRRRFSLAEDFRQPCAAQITDPRGHPGRWTQRSAPAPALSIRYGQHPSGARPHHRRGS